MTSKEPKRFRPSAKAVVVVDGRLLVTRNRTPGDARPDWHIVPGGGQRPGETLHEALVREVAEETGFEVVPGRLLWVRELIAARRTEFPFDPEDHAIEVMFAATPTGVVSEPSEVDSYQQEVVWVTGPELERIRFYPASLVPAIRRYMTGGDPGPVYLGDVD